MRDGDLGAAKGTITLKAREGESVLKVFEFGRRDEDRRRDTAISQSDVLMLSSSASEVTEFPSCFSNGIRSRHESSVHRHYT
jgi:hypothetical protein